VDVQICNLTFATNVNNPHFCSKLEPRNSLSLLSRKLKTTHIKHHHHNNMITYAASQLFGFNLLLRLHGSPVYKVIIPTTCSTVFLIVLCLYRDTSNMDEHDVVGDPYAVGALVSFFSFLLTFRLNFSYGRYWEGATALHQMQSKFLDACMTLAAFHYQMSTFDDIKPPTFGSHPHVNAKDLKTREPCVLLSQQETVESVRQLAAKQLEMENNNNNNSSGSFRVLRQRHAGAGHRRKASHVTEDAIRQHQEQTPKSINSKDITEAKRRGSEDRIPIPLRFQQQFLGGPSESTDSNSDNHAAAAAAAAAIHRSSVRGREGGLLAATQQQSQHQRSARRNLVRKNRKARLPAPDLFLQELAHLVSLLSAVALSTLRNDVEGSESPLTAYIPGQPWPPVDPDALSREIRKEYNEGNWFWTTVYYVLDISRSERRRTLYNAARPFSVLGGVSDAEIEQLQNARGPSAKTALCFSWFQEFMTRESLHGSFGDVNGAILSRPYQYTSDGMMGFHQARRVSFIPFPFPHAQITAFFSLVILFIFPILYYNFAETVVWFAAVLNFLTVLCFLGLHEVARELENPMQNTPNDLPMVTIQ
jgi:predicted membrane chloride channel (bestrophin family)